MIFSIYESLVTHTLDIIHLVPCIQIEHDENYVDFDDTKTWSSNVWLGGIQQQLGDADSTVVTFLSVKSDEKEE